MILQKMNSGLIRKIGSFGEFDLLAGRDDFGFKVVLAHGGAEIAVPFDSNANAGGVLMRLQNAIDKLPENIAMEVRFLKTTFLYQAGRDKDNKYPVKNFIEDSQLVEMVECIGTDVKKFDMFCKYVEALVAFYKYRAVSVIAAANEAWNKNKPFSNQNYNQSDGNRR